MWTLPQELIEMICAHLSLVDIKHIGWLNKRCRSGSKTAARVRLRQLVRLWRSPGKKYFHSTYEALRHFVHDPLRGVTHVWRSYQPGEVTPEGVDAIDAIIVQGKCITKVQVVTHWKEAMLWVSHHLSKDVVVLRLPYRIPVFGCLYYDKPRIVVSSERTDHVSFRQLILDANERKWKVHFCNNMGERFLLQGYASPVQ